MKLHNNTNLSKIAVFLAVSASVLAGVYISVRLGILLAPFVMAFILSSAMEPVIRLLERKLSLPRKLAAPVILIIILSAAGFLLVAIILKLAAEIKSIALILPQILAGWYNEIIRFINDIKNMYSWLPPEFTENIGSFFINLFNSLARLSNSIVKGAFATAVSLPQALIFILITIMATYFMSSDRIGILSSIRRQLPEKWISGIHYVKRDMFSALFGYVKATLIIMSFTFIELFVGFSIMHLEYSLLLAFLIAIIDALPVIGTGTVLLPWSVYSYAVGNLRTGTSLLILYAIVLIVRQITEPRIIGRQIGLHPLLTLAAMYAGLQLAGFMGMLIGPAAVILIKNIFSGLYRNKSIREIVKDGG